LRNIAGKMDPPQSIFLAPAPSTAILRFTGKKQIPINNYSKKE